MGPSRRSPALELVAEVDGVSTTDISTSDGAVVPLYGGKPGRTHADVKWSLKGDIFAAPELLRFSPIYPPLCPPPRVRRA